MLTLKEIHLRSPAKVNLFFRTLRKREDGFHEIASLYHTINLFDEIHISKSKIDSLDCSDASIPTGANNLIWKAANLFRKKTGVADHFSFRLKKNIPIQAGLGGGSSNAASVLWGLNQMHQSMLTLEQLMGLAAHIGSDVSFFLSLGTAYCTGRGEQIKELNALPKQSFSIVKPSYGLSTPKIYQAIDLNVLENRDSFDALEGFKKGCTPAFNDLESAAFKLEPRQKKLSDELKKNFDHVTMTGSGSAFMCWGDPKTLLSSNLIVFPVDLIRRLKNDWY